MRSFRSFVFSLLLLLAGTAAAGPLDGFSFLDEYGSLRHGSVKYGPGVPNSPVARAAGIREIVPKEFKDKYEKWKAELLATEYGRQQWAHYAGRTDFLLTIVVTTDRKFGAGTDDYEWSDAGELIAATITLGKNLDRGFPDPVYYPVMNSLATYQAAYEISGNILASTKMVHEIGHVNFTAKADSKQFQEQNKLMASYNKILLRNGYNARDPRLVALANEMGGNPVEIWEDREYWSEVGAMRYLLERINKESFFCSVVSRMQRNISNHARNYQERFQQTADARSLAACHN